MSGGRKKSVSPVLLANAKIAKKMGELWRGMSQSAKDEWEKKRERMNANLAPGSKIRNAYMLWQKEEGRKKAKAMI